MLYHWFFATIVLTNFSKKELCFLIMIKNSETWGYFALGNVPKYP